MTASTDTLQRTPSSDSFTTCCRSVRVRLMRTSMSWLWLSGFTTVGETSKPSPVNGTPGREGAWARARALRAACAAK